MMTHREIYEHLYQMHKEVLISLGLDEDKASRQANIKAVKDTGKVFRIHQKIHTIREEDKNAKR